MHTHQFQGVTTYVEGHLHLFSGVSTPSEDVPGHTHNIIGITTIASGHSHRYFIITQGPTIVGPGKHYHYFKGATGVTQGHSHPMESTTFVLGE